LEKSSCKPLKKQFLTNFIITKPKIVTLDCPLEREQQLDKGCIIDSETTGLDPNTDHMITFGILRRKTARIYQLTQTEYGSFKALATQKTQRSPVPHYAYNTRFEQDFLGLKDSKNWIDLTQYGEREWGVDEWGSPYYPMRLDSCTLTPFAEPDIVGSDVPPLWQEWLTKHKPQTLWQITLHCLSDLLRTRQLIKT